MLRGGNIARPSVSSDILFTPISVFVISLVAKTKKVLGPMLHGGNIARPSVSSDILFTPISVFVISLVAKTKKVLGPLLHGGNIARPSVSSDILFTPISVFVISLVAKTKKVLGPMLHGGNIARPSVSSDILFTPISVFVIFLVAKTKKGLRFHAPWRKQKSSTQFSLSLAPLSRQKNKNGEGYLLTFCEISPRMWSGLGLVLPPPVLAHLLLLGPLGRSSQLANG